MSVDLPPPIAIYIAAENHGDTEALAECFVEDAIVRDEGQPSRIWSLSNDGRRMPVVCGYPLHSGKPNERPTATNNNQLSTMTFSCKARSKGRDESRPQAGQTTPSYAQ